MATETQSSYHRFLIKHRIWCESRSEWATCCEPATKVVNINGRDEVRCDEHASRLANVRKSERKQHETNDILGN